MPDRFLIKGTFVGIKVEYAANKTVEICNDFAEPFNYFAVFKLHCLV